MEYNYEDFIKAICKAALEAIHNPAKKEYFRDEKTNGCFELKKKCTNYSESCDLNNGNCKLTLEKKWRLAFNKNLSNKQKKKLLKDKLDIIKVFQKGTRYYLKVNYNSYRWRTESKPSGRKEKDSIDIKGYPKSNNDLTCIIEIDACRQDQVEEKFLSRLALWGIKKPIIYVALIYSKPNSSKNMV